MAQELATNSKFLKEKTILTVTRTLRKYLEEPTDASERKKLSNHTDKITKAETPFVLDRDTNLLRRHECKISEQTGNPEQNDKLSCVSLSAKLMNV